MSQETDLLNSDPKLVSVALTAWSMPEAVRTGRWSTFPWEGARPRGPEHGRERKRPLGVVRLGGKRT